MTIRLQTHVLESEEDVLQSKDKPKQPLAVPETEAVMKQEGPISSLQIWTQRWECILGKSIVKKPRAKNSRKDSIAYFHCTNLMRSGWKEVVTSKIIDNPNMVIRGMASV